MTHDSERTEQPERPHRLADHRKRLQVYVGPSVYRAVLADAGEQGLSVSDLVVGLLERHYAARETAG